jgi:tRNA(Ile)-lysidine synthase
MPDDTSPISASEARRLFADWKKAPAIVLAVSGGPDSMALMCLAARWRRALAQGPRLVAVTIDHGLRAEAAQEARAVKRLARRLDLTHRTMRWTAVKPNSGIPAAARTARYHLLTRAAQECGATHILTAHTRDDQAETLLMRMLRGSGIAGLAAMARQSERAGVVLARPFLDVSKSRLLATLKKAGIDFADDPTNRDVRFTRPRLRAILPVLAAEGGDARNLARLASRLARVNAAVEIMVDGAERYLALRENEARPPGLAVDSFDSAAFAGLPDEIRLRLLLRAINRRGHEGPAELGKAEVLLAALDRAAQGSASHRKRPGLKPTRLKQTLAGALVSLSDGRIRIEPSPPRRRQFVKEY